MRKRFAIQKHINVDGMVLYNRLATSKKKGGGGGYAELKSKIGINALRRQYKAGKRHREITRLQNRCACNFITVGYIHI